jgi:tRNA dimethylallyltransferase
MDAKLVVIVGETASGKSALALRLAELFDGELVCADSWTVYKGFDIGTAKPSPEERARIPHHLLDIADPAVGFSAVEFQRQARGVIDDISAKGKLPVMVGGTGLYIDSVLYGYQFLPAPPAGLRQELDVLTLPQLLERAAAAGLDLGKVDQRNKRRVIRLIENNGAVPTKQALRPNTLVLGLHVPREQLRVRVEQRIDAMLAAGLKQEAHRLAEQYGWEAEPMKGIGYREWQPYFEPVPGNHQDLAQTRERIISSTMRLAKRQRTWFQHPERAKSIQWLTLPHIEKQVVELVTTFMRR